MLVTEFGPLPYRHPGWLSCEAQKLSELFSAEIVSTPVWLRNDSKCGRWRQTLAVAGRVPGAMNLRQTDLENAIRHVKETEARVAEQQGRVARLRRHGQPTQAAEDLLDVLQKALALMKAHLGTLTQPVEPKQ